MMLPKPAQTPEVAAQDPKIPDVSGGLPGAPESESIEIASHVTDVSNAVIEGACKKALKKYRTLGGTEQIAKGSQLATCTTEKPEPCPSPKEEIGWQKMKHSEGYERFTDAVRNIMSVPKTETLRREAEYKKQADANPHKRGPKRKVKPSASPSANGQSD